MIGSLADGCAATATGHAAEEGDEVASSHPVSSVAEREQLRT